MQLTAQVTGSLTQLITALQEVSSPTTPQRACLPKILLFHHQVQLSTKKLLQSILKGKKQFEETELASELDPNMAGLLGILDRLLNTTIINKLIALMEKENVRTDV